MIPNGQSKQSPAVQSKRLYAGKKIAPVAEGASPPPQLSAEYFNQFVTHANAWEAIEVYPPGAGQFIISDNKVVFQSNASGSNTGGGAVTSSGTNQLTLFKPTTFYGVDFYAAQRVTNGDITSPTLSGVTEYIAKPLEFRPSVTGDSIDGVAITYDYGSPSNDNLRISSDGTNSQAEVPIPRYAVNDLKFIWAMPANHTQVLDGGGNEATWIEVLPHRVWARRDPPST